MTRPLTVFRRRRFGTVVIGEGLSMIGDAAFEIALAWTILRSTGSIAALAGVLLVQAVPRGVLLLLGGAVVDRYSPRAVMIVTHGVRAVALMVLAVVAATGPLALWHLAGLALVMGVCAAFFSPAAESIVPSLVEKHELAQANAVRGLFEQMALIAGPVIGGVLASVTGTWVVLGFNALTFAVAAFTVLAAPKTVQTGGRAPSPTETLRQIGEGLGHAGRSHEVRLVLIVISAATLSYSGIFAVGLPVLATSLGGASSLGLMVAGWGAGQLVGALAATLTGLPRRWGLLIIGMTLVEAAMFTTLGLVSSVWAAAGLLFVVGIGCRTAATWPYRPSFRHKHRGTFLAGSIPSSACPGWSWNRSPSPSSGSRCRTRHPGDSPSPPCPSSSPGSSSPSTRAPAP